MKSTQSRSGSALLIVIGMLAFLIVSAVGFSAYMRYARLPSSYLRRSASSRQLVKAAMAQAIDALDRSINNNPHPGVGSLASSSGRNSNYWHHRVLMGTNSWSDADYSSTVSPLCLEALAYIPPVLVNEARYFSRLSATSRWKSFDFDIGRYAFTVLDVSDYFDINRMFADQRRSSAPNQRISLSYIFENGRRHTAVGQGSESWDKFMENFREVDPKTKEISFEGKYPLISLADFNLALGRKGEVGGMKSPFYDYVSSSGSRNGFYDVGKNGNEASDALVTRMTFVTDGLFPDTTEKKTASSGQSSGDGDSSEKVYDLADPANQPFNTQELSSEEPNKNALSLTLMARNLQGEAKKEWPYALSTVGCVALYDYLDADRVPLSLALPTVERVPMVCGVHPIIDNVKFAVRKEFMPTDSDTSPTYSKIISSSENTRVVEKTVLYKIDGAKFVQGFSSAVVRALTVFPFPRKDDNDGGHKIDGRLSLFFASEKMALRTGSVAVNNQDLLHLDKEIGDTAVEPEKGLINFKLNYPGQISFTEIKEEVDAVEKVDFRIGAEAPRIATAFALEDNALLKVVYRWTQTSHKDQQSGMTIWSPSIEKVIQENKIENISSAHTAFAPLKANGAKDEAFANGEALKNTILTGKDVNLNCAVWLRVKDDEDNVVDMVPACIGDDGIQNGVDAGQAKLMCTTFGDASYPLLRFNTGVSFNFSLAKLEEMASNNGELDLKLEPKAAIVADPRHNHAPEEWFAFNEELSEQNWIANNKTGEGDRDRDIFMATSDAGYLQSIYELAFMPRFNTLRDTGNSKPVNMKTDFSTQSKYVDIATSFDETRNRDMAWRTYDPFDIDAEAFRELPFTNEGDGFKVNPYSDSTNVLMAVFANTPLDWRRASTNEVDGAVNYADMTMKDFNQKYAFNAYSSEGKIDWEDLEAVAGRFMECMRSHPNEDWEDVWCKRMDWRGGSKGENRFCGVEFQSECRFWDVDKKFLYGFWKDCFAVKQQLFLVFVRAEPMMMGSGASGQIPPQLGGKAMALVWRDPARTRNNDTPHRTRILFYRHFD